MRSHVDSFNPRSLPRLICVALLCLLGGCSQAESGKGGEEAKAFALKDYLCAITPADCHGKLIQNLYLAPADAMYERKVGGKKVRIPMAYLSFIELLQDPRQQKDDASLYLESLLPDIGPRTPQNLREYFTPYERSRIGIIVGDRRPGAIDWKEGLESTRTGTLRASSSPIRRPDKYGLEVWGENFEKWPRHIPCASPDQEFPICGRQVTPRDVLSPLQSRTSLIICDADALPDADAKVMAMPEAEREAFFASKKWSGQSRAMCKHDMYYEPLNARISLDYPRRFLAQWQKTEARVRELLDSFLVADQPATK
ncbi:hypothetical protein J7E49_16905 [Variovorax paradoxus]|nr:hypothetical protein [Variovorax paradoxus]